MNFSWIIEDELMISSIPENEKMLNYLKQSGIKAVISACETPFCDSAFDELRLFNLPLHIKDFTPPTLSQLREFVRFCSFMRDAKQPILIHCMAGYGRSATLAACYLVIFNDMSAEDAIFEIREIRGDSAVETEQQVAFVTEAEYVKELLLDESAQSYYNTKLLVDLLRRNCPWDKKMTQSELAPHLLEEVYEAWDSIKRDNTVGIKSEFGDILLLLLMITRIRSEKENFSFDDIMTGMTKKMISRHPHVFGKSNTDTPDKVLHQWQNIKKTEPDEINSISEIPTNIPVLGRANAVMSYAKRLGFDWPYINGPREKLNEELSELDCAIKEEDKAHIKSEFGDVFFTLLNIARFLRVNPEDALSDTLTKFTNRFVKIEQTAKESNIEIKSMTLEQMDNLWNNIKKKL